jgi:DNA alkylation damage repair protein AlkB
MIPLFDSNLSPRSQEQLEEGAMLLRGFAAAEAPVLIDEVARIAQTAAFRYMVTPGGYTMSVAMTNCGRLGWVSDRTGYRYTPVDPDTGAPWPAMPAAFLDIAVRAAAEAGFANYDPDACLINRYIPGAKLSLHQDRDEKDAWAPIVSYRRSGQRPTAMHEIDHGDNRGPEMVYFGAMRQRAILVIPVLATLASCSHPTKSSEFVQTVEGSKPIAYFRLESPVGISQAGGAAYTSTPSVASSSSCAPINISGNHCVEFNGKDGAITTTQQGGVQTAGSIAAWVKLAVLPSKSDHILFIAGISQSGNDFDLQFEQDDALRFFTAGGGAVEYKPAPSTLTGKWHMIVATLDTASKTRALYWDGNLAKSDSGGGTPNKTNLFSIGESTVFRGRFFNGSIDEVALWDRALTGAEVAKLYNSTNP